jgi:hypothetical protein
MGRPGDSSDLRASCPKRTLISMGGCITSTLTGRSAVEVVGAVLGAVSSRAGRGLAALAGGESLRLIARRPYNHGPSVRAFVSRPAMH